MDSGDFAAHSDKLSSKRPPIAVQMLVQPEMIPGRVDETG